MNDFIKNIIWLFLLVLLQVLIFNNINLFGYTNPLIYVVFVFYYPLKKEKGAFLFLSFLLGLFIDFFSNSGGIHAAATLFIAFIRLPLLTSILNKTDFDYHLFNIRSISFFKAFSFISIQVLIHHLIVFSLDYFSFSDFGKIISKTLTTSGLTIVLILIGIVLFTKKK
ncbi:rod shape-determining protein MreD [Urechidicola vernalis]|uniref:Rod shape-determining protein MreD n=1 Tax=Urechidicola vernalis TaxID=3075600 RepID=A0ABU2Y6K2_9FLAO|nr:rod shape-determining protein MreD [Urechidicola sp. P050]MDT0553259.1 rod shape-determining protein MreD [Urechidicola sp. P050]